MNNIRLDLFPLLSSPEWMLDYIRMELDDLPDFPYYDNYLDGNSTNGMDDINQMLDFLRDIEWDDSIQRTSVGHHSYPIPHPKKNNYNKNNIFMWNCCINDYHYLLFQQIQTLLQYQNPLIMLGYDLHRYN